MMSFALMANPTWVLPKFGRSNLIVEDRPRPAPPPGRVVIEVEAVSLNYRDLLILEDRLGPEYSVPLVPATDVAGVVVGLGEGVSRFGVGDRVIANDISGWIDGAAPALGTNTATLDGRLSRYVVMNPDQLVRAPATLTAVEASTLPTAGLTAWMAIVELGRIRAGQSVLVQGTGGVSSFAIQFARAHGARVIVTTTSDEKIARLRALGVAEAIDRRKHPEWHLELARMVGERGVDHVIEMAGGDNLDRSLSAVALGGRISMVGLLEEARLGGSVGMLFYKRATIAGIGVGSRRALEDMVRAVDQLALKPVIDQVYEFADAPAAFEHLSRGAFGKVVISMK